MSSINVDIAEEDITVLSGDGAINVTQEQGAINVDNDQGTIEVSQDEGTINVTQDMYTIEVTYNVGSIEVTTEVQGPSGPPGDPGQGVPTGGVAGEFLKKASSTNYDTLWSVITQSDVTGLVSALASKEASITAGTTSQYWRGDKTFQTLDTSVVPENGNLYFNTARVLATALTGLSVTGSTIVSTDTLLQAFGKAQNQINALVGGVNYQGTWNATTNSPTITGSSGTKGYYYVISVAGSTSIDGITDWKLGDWIIFNGATWQKVDNTDAVISVNGYTGIVTLATADITGLQTALDAKLTNSMSTNKLIGRGTAGTGVMEEITLGTNLSLSGTTLNATGGGTPGGSDTQVQYNDSGAFGGDVNFTWNKTSKTLTLGASSLDARLVTHAIKSDASDGLLIEASNGTDVGLLGAGNTANATWYGNHNWTGRLASTLTGLASTTSDAFLAENTTAATTGSRIQVSPASRWSARGWNSGGAGSSQSIDFRSYVLPETGASGAQGYWKLQSSSNGASYVDLFTVKTTGEAVLNTQSGLSAVTGLELNGTFSNSTPGTTRNVKFSNNGSHSWLDFYFGGTQKGAIGVDNTGTFNFDTISIGKFRFYGNLAQSDLWGELYSVGFYTSNGGFFGGRLTAGSAVTSPPTTFSNYGSTSLKTEVITAPTTLTDSYTQVIVDCSSYNICSGTPSVTDCSTYTGSGEATCVSHLPCSWYAGDSCSVFNNEFGMGSCTAQSPCSADTSSCSPYNSDQTTCESADDTYGGNCTWDAGTNTCPSQDCTTCAGAGCSPNLGGDCSVFSDGGGDGAACYAAPCGACSYDSGSGVCSGNYFISCDGDNTTPSCNGTLFTGNCSGVYGTACSGTATCGDYPDSSACTGEAGCSWVSGVAITMPSNPIEQTYWIAKDYTSGVLTILPNSGQTINNTTSITSSSTAGVGWMLTWIESKSNWYIMNSH